MYPSLEAVFSKLASMIPRSMILGSIKDNLTIAEHAAFFAEEVGFKKSLIPALRLGVIARDIGMLFIPVQILTKTAALSREEYSQIQRHMIYGESIVRAVKDPHVIIAANIIRSHHERWSGSGQPDGLREEEIPLEARIVSIIGAFHSIRAKRAYRPGCSPEEALQYMKKTKGEFDPALFSKFCEERIFLWKPSAH
jgi:putative two-component system response regulator